MFDEKDLGRTFIDKVTGFKGVATGFCVYISGCNQMLLVAKADDKGVYQSAWFDVQRLELDTEERIISLDNEKTPGCDIPAPIR